jgi:hypothetical protein
MHQGRSDKLPACHAAFFRTSNHRIDGGQAGSLRLRDEAAHRICKKINGESIMVYRTDNGYESQAVGASQVAEGHELSLVDDLAAYLRRYARERPETIACICFGFGFILGWKLKPW